MAEEVGSLRVGLSIDSAKFEQSMASVDRNLKALGQEMAIVRAKGSEWGSSIEGLGSKQKSLSSLLETQDVKVRKLNEAYQTAVTEQGANSQAAENLAIKLNKATAEYTKTQTELSQVTNSLKKQEVELKQNESAWTKLSKATSAASEKLQAAGEKMTSIGKELSMKLTAPVVGLGVASAKVAIDFEAQMDRVGAIADATSGEMNKLSQTALDLGANTSKSASEVAKGMEEMAAMGFTANEIIGAMPGVISAAEASGSDMAQTAEVMASTLNIFGLEASNATKVADILAKTANISAASLTDMQYALKYAGPPAAALGISLEELSAGIGIMTNAGMKGEQAGTSLRSALLGLLDPSEENSKRMTAMGVAITDNEGNFVGLSNLIENLTESMEGQTDTQKAATISALVGKEAVSGMLSLMKAGPSTIDKMTKSLEESGGASADAAAKMRDNLKGSLDELKGAFETAGITIGQIMTPTIEKLATHVQKVVDKFQNLSPASQEAIVKFGLIAAAAGPLLVAFGFIASALGSSLALFGTVAGAVTVVTTGVAAATPAIGGLASAFALLTGPVGLTIGALAALGIGAVAVGKNFSEDAIPEIDRFGEGVSETTKKSLEKFFELSDGVGQAMSDLSITSGIVTEEMKTGMIEKFAQMNDQILQGMNTKHQEQLDSMSSFFANSSVLTDGEEARIIAAQVKSNSDQLTEQQKREDRIKQIIETAYKEKRELTTVEEAAINGIKEEMNRAAVKNLSQSELEQKIIFERMRLTAGDLSTKQAAAVVKNSADQRDKTIKAAEEQYEGTIGQIIRMRDETRSITKENADKMIAEAGKARDSTVKHAQGMHASVVTEAQKQATEHIKEVDWETGQIKSKWQVFHEDNKKMWTDFANYLAKTDLKQIGIDIMDGLKNGIEARFPGVIEEAKKIGHAIAEATERALQIKSPSRVMYAIGEHTGQGLAYGIASTKTNNEKVMRELGSVIKNVAKSNASEIAEVNKKATAEQKAIATKAAADIANIHAIAADYKRKLTGNEVRRIQKIEDEADAKILANKTKHKAEIAKIEASTSKERLDAVKQFLDNKRGLEQLSLIEEANVWRQAVMSFKEGTQEKIAANLEYRNALEKVNAEITTINETYAGKMATINERLQSQEAELTKTYMDSLDSRSKSLMSFAGLFDTFDVKVEKSGVELLSNLNSQVDGFKLWQSEIEKLSGKAIDEGLLAELREMGAKALPELLALNSLTAEQLTQYSALYSEKTALARSQAEAELVGMKEDTTKRIAEIRAAAKTELAVLQTEWAAKIRSVTQATNEEFKSLTQIGISAGQNLLDGLKSMEGPLVAQATAIAQAINSALQSVTGGSVSIPKSIGAQSVNAAAQNNFSPATQNKSSRISTSIAPVSTAVPQIINFNFDTSNLTDMQKAVELLKGLTQANRAK